MKKGSMKMGASLLLTHVVVDIIEDVVSYFHYNLNPEGAKGFIYDRINRIHWIFCFFVSLQTKLTNLNPAPGREGI